MISGPPGVSPTAGHPPAGAPTTVLYGDRVVKARIDSNVPLDEVLRQLCTSNQLNISEPPTAFALRDAADDSLVTEQNFCERLAAGARFKLVSSPRVEANEMVARLQSGDLAVIKMATFSLKTYVKEPAFTAAFVSLGGVIELNTVIQQASGNTLAYALTSLQSLLEMGQAMVLFEDDLIRRLVHVVAHQSLTNIVRPATAILRNYLVAEIDLPDDPNAVGTSRTQAQVHFTALWKTAQEEGHFLPAVAQRLSAGDKLLVQASLALLNAMTRPAVDLQTEAYLGALSQLDIQSSVLRLAEAGPSSDLLPFILEYQAVLISVYRADIRPLDRARQAEMGLVNDLAERVQSDLVALAMDWKDLDGSLGRPGLLGLKALVSFSQRKRDFDKILAEQREAPETRWCPIARASAEVLEELGARIHFFSTEAVDVIDIDLILLSWQHIYALALKMFFRFWKDSAASLPDFPQVAALVRSQIKTTIAAKAETSETLQGIEGALLSAEYRIARDRLSKQLEIEDDLLLKAPIRTLRARLYKESFEFVRAQRLQCLAEGAWFQHSVGNRRPVVARLWRFYRLSSNQRFLHFVERDTRIPIKAGLEELPDRIDLELVSEVVPQQSTATKGQHRSPSSPRPSTVPSDPDAALRFSLVSGEQVLADLQAPDPHVYAEWLDGLSLLKPSGHIQTQETADLIQVLTEIGIKVKLLDLTGERVEIPSHCPIVGVPLSDDFYYGGA